MRAVRVLRVCQASVLPVILLAHVVAQWVVLPRVNSFRADSGVLAEGLWVAQLTLLTGWALLGPWRWYVRWPLAFGGAAFLLWPDPPPLGLLLNLSLWLSLAVIGLIGFVLAANRLRGRRLLIIDGPEPAGVPLRFSIRLICLLTTLAAVLMRAGMVHRESLTAAVTYPYYTTRVPHVLGSPLFNEPRVSIWFTVGMNGLALAAIGLLSFWAVLSPGRTWWRLLLLAAAVGLFGVAVPWGGGKEDDILVMLGWYAASATFVTATLFVMRAAGYRWMKRGGAATPTSASCVTHDSPLRMVRRLARSLPVIVVFGLLTLGAMYARGNPTWPTSNGPLARLDTWIEGELTAALRRYNSGLQ